MWATTSAWGTAMTLVKTFLWVLALTVLLHMCAGCAGPQVEHSYSTKDFAQAFEPGKYEYKLKLTSKVEW